MGKRVQFIRHTTGGADAFVGYQGEITVDTTKKELRVHDSLTAGGVPTARSDLANVSSATTAVRGAMDAAHVVQLNSATADIEAETTNRIADVDAEETRATLAETTLQANIDAEASARSNADTTLQTNIDTVQTNLDAEEAARIAADSALESSIKAATIAAIYPVGALYFSNSSTNPATILGVGTWTAIPEGTVVLSAGLTYPAGSTGGSKDAAVVAHDHIFTGVALPTHTHTLGYAAEISGNYVTRAGSVLAGTIDAGMSAVSAGTPEGSISSAGVSGTDANMQPYIAKYIWERTA